MQNILTFEKLESLYSKYNKRKFVEPDPLQFLYNYKNPLDIEIVGLIASSLAYGRVQQILKAIDKVLKLMGPSPRAYLINNAEEKFSKDLSGFKYRFTTELDMLLFFKGIKKTLEEHGSLKNTFSLGYSDSDDNIIPATTKFVEKINHFYEDRKSYLLPSPTKKSACKRFMLYLRWMVRQCEVDLGCWSDIVSPSKLLYPVDTHIHKISLLHGITTKKNANLDAVVDITNFYKKININDPVKYDFTICRFGIRDELEYSDIEK